MGAGTGIAETDDVAGTTNQFVDRASRWSYTAALLLSLVLFGCGSGKAASTAPGPDLQPREAYRFATLPTLVATVDLVAVGTVTDIQAGRTVGPKDEEIQYQDVVFHIDELLNGTTLDETVTIETLELGQTNSGSAEWRDEGRRILAFLAKSSDAEESDKYHPINITQSMFVLDGEDLRATAASDAFANQIASLTLPQVEVAVQEAIDLIERGTVVPQRPRQPAA